MTGLVDFRAAEELLLAAEFDDLRPVWYSSNYVYVARMCAPGGEPFDAIYKPRRGERPLWDFPEGTLHQREAAAYQLSLLLGWPFIPPTVLREGPGGIGSLQLFVDHDPERHFFEQRADPALIPQLQRMAIFDYVANNADRKGGHCLLDLGGRVWGIDHGLCFHAQYKLRSVIWDWAGEPIPGEWLAGVEAAGAVIAEDGPPAAALSSLIGSDERLAIVGRIEELLASRRFPQPGPHRSYPWPLV